jgi:hypothetical protein
MMARGLITGLNNPYLIRGFKISIPTAAVNASSLSIEVADSALLHSSATESGTILLIDPTEPLQVLDSTNTKVIGSFQPNTVNYIGLDYRRVSDTTTLDQTAGWSASQNLEYQRSVPIGRILDYRFVVSTNGFGKNLPLYLVKTTSTNAVEWISKASPNLFRLGSGGANPDPYHSFNFGVEPLSGERSEYLSTNPNHPNPVTTGPNPDSNVFEYGDFAIKNLKEWMDAVMTRFKEIGNSTFWYKSSLLPDSAANTSDIWNDALGSVLTGVGNLSYNLILESSLPSTGAFQSRVKYPDISAGDVFVKGLTSSAKATLSSYSNGKLVVNSLTGGTFIYNEDLKTYRSLNPDKNLFEIMDANWNGSKFAHMRMLEPTPSTLSNIVSWSYENMTDSDEFSFSVIKAIVTDASAMQAGDLMFVTGLLLPDPEYHIENVVQLQEVNTSTNEVTFIWGEHLYLSSGVPTVESGNSLGPASHSSVYPFMPRFLVDSWELDGTNAKITTNGQHNIRPIRTYVCDTNLGSNIITTVSTAELVPGDVIVGAGIADYSVVATVDSLTQFTINKNATATASGVTLEARHRILVSGLETSNSDFPKTSWFDADVDSENYVIIDVGSASGTPQVASGAHIKSVFHKSEISVFEATPSEYSVGSQALYLMGETAGVYYVGPDTLPVLNQASGPYYMEVVVAESIVQDPAKVSTISNAASGWWSSTYANPEYIKVEIEPGHSHNLSTSGSGFTSSVTIYGDSTKSVFIKSYSNVNIIVIDSEHFIIQDQAVTSVQADYTNSGLADSTFVNFADNPYSGPIAWDADMVIKSIVGDKRVVIPATATCYDSTVENQSSAANQFNINGITGTAYLQDGEVAYIILDRNKVVSSGAYWSVNEASNTIIGSTLALDKDNLPLEEGDFVKFEDEDDSKWIRISSVGATSISITTDDNQTPTALQRPAKSGRLVYAKGTYNKLYVKPHHAVEPSADVYWLAVRRDNYGYKSKVYFRGLELTIGEVREISAPTSSNILLYIGAESEASVNPTYTAIDSSGDYKYSEDFLITQIDNATKMVTLNNPVPLGPQVQDRIVKITGTTEQVWTIKHLVTSKTFIVTEDTADLSAGDAVKYRQMNQNIQDSDNLTLAIRKEDRNLGSVQTALSKPVYDESVYIQQIILTSGDNVKSGSYIYQGPQYNPTALAWVLHGNQTGQTDTVEGASLALPGGHPSLPTDAALIHVYSGTFSSGDVVYQNSSAVGTITGSITAPALYGNTTAGGVELILPPNRRTEVKGSGGYVTFGTHSFYKASEEETLAGEELMVFVNDTARQAAVDYDETFGGPKAKIRLRRTTPPNTRMRFRVMSSFGSVVAAKAGDVTLQSAYNSGATIGTSAGRPVTITSNDTASGAVGQLIRGSLQINGGVNQLGGIYNETGAGDQTFVVGNENDKPKEVWSGLEAVKTHTSHPGSAWIRKTAAQIVIGDAATAITGSAITLEDNTTYRIKISAVGRRSDGTFGAGSFSIEGTFYRSLGGSAQAAGMPVSYIIGADGDGQNWAIVFGVSGNDVTMMVYGSAGATIQWVCSIDYQAVAST